MHQVARAPHRQRGLTIIELMVVVAIVGILMAMAAPSFNEAITRNRISTQNNDLMTSFAYARGEAIRRNNRVGVCALNAAGTGCATDNWNRGWLVWVDTNRNGAFNAGTDEVLRINTLNAADRITSGVFNIHFGPRGTRVLPIATAANPALALRPATCASTRRNVRTLTVRITGSVSSVESACP